MFSKCLCLEEILSLQLLVPKVSNFYLESCGMDINHTTGNAIRNNMA